MTKANQHQHPAIHNAMWPGLVGKGPDSEPSIDLETMLDLTAQAEVNGVRFDGVDLFLSLPHTSIDSTDDELKHLADRHRPAQSGRGLARRPRLAANRRRLRHGFRAGAASFLTQVKKACAIGKKLRDLGIRPYGVIRIDSAASPADWAKDPAAQYANASQRLLPKPAKSPKTMASAWPPREKSAGEACTAGSGWSSCWRW